MELIDIWNNVLRLWPLWAFIGVMSIAAFVTFGLDKFNAKRRGPRTPETVLLTLCFLGGGVGGWIAMGVFRHKTLHYSFTIGVPVSVLLWLTASILLIAFA